MSPKSNSVLTVWDKIQVQFMPSTLITSVSQITTRQNSNVFVTWEFQKYKICIDSHFTTYMSPVSGLIVIDAWSTNIAWYEMILLCFSAQRKINWSNLSLNRAIKCSIIVIMSDWFFYLSVLVSITKTHVLLAFHKRRTITSLFVLVLLTCR